MKVSPQFSKIFLPVLFFIFSLLSFNLYLYSQTNVQTYTELVSAIRRVRHASEARVEAAVEEEKVREAWETGKLIDEHILLHKERQEYGSQIIIRLAKDLETSETELRYMLQFARAYPIHRTSDELSWGQIQSLLAINDNEKRESLAKTAAAENWSVERTREEVRKHKTASQPSPKEKTKFPEIKPGKTGVYRVLEKNGKQYYDLGLSTYLEIKGKAPKQTNPPKEELYTYKAQVIDVYDGDTFHARIDLGFGVMSEQRVRLLRIDAREIESSEGKESKALLEKILARDGGRILIQTKEIDQHGRPLANVWVKGKAIDQELVDNGLAVRIEE